MRLPKEIQVLLALLVIMIVGVLWYVIDRRARQRATPPPPVATSPLAPVGPVRPAPVVNLSEHDRQTIDFSSGAPVVKNSPEDQAAVEAALKDIAAATKDVTFRGTGQKPEAPKK